MTKAQIARHMTTGQAARKLGVSLRTVQLWANDGTIPCLTTARGHRRFAAAHVELLRQRLMTRTETGPQRLPTLAEYAAAASTGADTASDDLLVILRTMRAAGPSSVELLVAHDQMRADVSLPPLARTPGDDRTLANVADVTTHAAFVRGVLWLRAQLLASLSTTND